jgi:hypothetical protein
MYKFDNLDIADCKRAAGYVHYLIALQNLNPICWDGSLRPEQKRLLAEIERVCNQIEAYLSQCEPGNLRSYSESYAMLYPLAKMEPLDPQRLDDVDYRILDAWTGGDAQISDIEAYSIVGRHLKHLSKDLRSWYQRRQAEYFLALDEAGTFSSMSLADNYRVLTALWTDSIWSRFPDCTYGRGDVAIINTAVDFNTFDTATLREYYRFQMLYSSVLPSNHAQLRREASLLGELGRRADLDEYDRQAYLLDLEALNGLSADNDGSTTTYDISIGTNPYSWINQSK